MRFKLGDQEVQPHVGMRFEYDFVSGRLCIGQGRDGRPYRLYPEGGYPCSYLCIGAILSKREVENKIRGILCSTGLHFSEVAIVGKAYAFEIVEGMVSLRE